MINRNVKGKGGEREVAAILNTVVNAERTKQNLQIYVGDDKPFQRNQNQSAVGGFDLVNPYNLGIEIKRCQALSLTAWWKQTIKSCDKNGERPILMYRQNNKKWRIRMYGLIPLDFGYQGSIPMLDSHGFICEIDLDAFKTWFSIYYRKFHIGRE